MDDPAELQAVRKLWSAASMALPLGMLALSACNAQDKGSNVAVVNGVPISQARMDYVVKAQVQQGQKDDETMRKNVREALITREILTQEAVNKGLDKDPLVQTQLEMARRLSVSKAHLSDIENDRKVVSIERAARWAKKLGYHPTDFVRLALADAVRRAGLPYRVTVEEARGG